MAINDQEFEKLLEEYGTQRRAEMDEACRLYRMPVAEVLQQVRARGRRKPAWQWITGTWESVFPKVPGWGAAVGAVAAVAILCAVMVKQSAGNWVSYRAEENNTAAYSAAPKIELPENLNLDLKHQKVRFDSEPGTLTGDLTRTGEAAGLVFQFTASGELDGNSGVTVEGTIAVNPVVTGQNAENMEVVTNIKVQATITMKGGSYEAHRTYNALKSVPENKPTN